MGKAVPALGFADPVPRDVPHRRMPGAAAAPRLAPPPLVLRAVIPPRQALLAAAGPATTGSATAGPAAQQVPVAHFGQEAGARPRLRAQSLSSRGRDQACGDEAGRARPPFVVKPRAKPKPTASKFKDMGMQSKKLDEGSIDKLDGEDKDVIEGATGHGDKTSKEKASEPIEAEHRESRSVHFLLTSAEASGIPPLRTPPLLQPRPLEGAGKPPPKRIKPVLVDIEESSIEAAWSSPEKETALSSSDDDSWGVWRAAS